MAKAKKDDADTKKTVTKKPTIIAGAIDLAEFLDLESYYQDFDLWLIGNTPLIVHAWSMKAKREMLLKQTSAPKRGKEARNPHKDFVDSLYIFRDRAGKPMTDERGQVIYGFPATGVKNCILSAAHKDKGIARNAVMGGLWINADLVSVQTAEPGAICDMPLIRLYGSNPQNREDMVKIGAGLNKTANLAYRGQYTQWAMNVTGRFNVSVVTPSQLAFLISEAGIIAGLGEWRNERKGMFGAFRMANGAEKKAWSAYRDGRGPLPVPEGHIAGDPVEIGVDGAPVPGGK